MSEETYAFIDSQNLHLGIKTQGWCLDYKKFRIYLKDKYNVKKAFLFIGYISKYKNLYKRLSDFGYELVFKPTMKIRGSFKGNIDAELVLYSSAIEIDNYNKAIIISGDGDFYCLAKFLLKKNKLDYIFIPNRKAYSHLLNDFYKYLRFVDDVKSKIKKGTVALSTNT